MKTTLRKSIILATVFIICVAAVVVFIITIVKPPTELKYSSAAIYEKNIKNELAQFSSDQDESELEQSYQKFLDMVNYYYEEHCINDKTLQQKKNTFYQKYIPLYTEFCKQKFYNSYWYDSDHELMLNRIDELKNASLSENLVEQLNEITDIIDNYRNARRLIANTSFQSAESIEKRLSEAERYKNMQPLTYCTDLQEKLNSYPTTLEAIHYSYVRREVDKMSHYSDTKYDYFQEVYKYKYSEFEEKFADPALEAIIDYKNISHRNSRYDELYSLFVQYKSSAKNTLE